MSTVVQEGHPEVFKSCDGEHCYARCTWPKSHWSWSFICSHVWQLAEDAGNSDEIQVPNVLMWRRYQVTFYLFCFRCNIPVVLIGETGCGKTRLVRYMCQLQAKLKMSPQSRDSPQTFFILKVDEITCCWVMLILNAFLVTSRFMVELQRKI